MTVLNEARAMLTKDVMLVLERCNEITISGTVKSFTQLRAYGPKDEVKMHVDNVPIHSMGLYLDMARWEIERCRERLYRRPDVRHRKIETIQQFVNNLVFLNMLPIDYVTGRDHPISGDGREAE